MRNDKIIAHAKKNYIFFTLDSPIPGQVMSAINKMMEITG